MILVTGATGNVGRELVGLLLDAGQKVTAVTRDPARSGLPAGARLAAADLSDPAAIAPALEGAEAIFVNLAAVGPGLPALMRLASQQGVQRVVLLSGLSADPGHGENAIAAPLRAAEAAVLDAGLPATILRPGEFAANSLAWAPQIRAAGVVRMAFPDAATSPVHERDIAAVAAAALTGPGHAGQSYVLTGPESITQAERVAAIGAAVGRELSVAQVSPEQAVTAMTRQGFPQVIAEAMLRYQAEAVGRPAFVDAAAAEVTGRPALPFAAWAADHVGAFRA